MSISSGEGASSGGVTLVSAVAAVSSGSVLVGTGASSSGASGSVTVSTGSAVAAAGDVMVASSGQLDNSMPTEDVLTMHETVWNHGKY